MADCDKLIKLYFELGMLYTEILLTLAECHNIVLCERHLKRKLSCLKGGDKVDTMLVHALIHSPPPVCALCKSTVGAEASKNYSPMSQTDLRPCSEYLVGMSWLLAPSPKFTTMVYNIA